MVSIAIRVGYIGHRVGHNIEKVSNSIGKVSGSIDKTSAIWEDSMRVRLECRRIKCFEGARCDIVRKTDVLQKKRERGSEFTGECRGVVVGLRGDHF
jgi:hypothetical protein